MRTKTGNLSAVLSKTTSAAYVVHTDARGRERVLKVCPHLMAARCAIYRMLKARERGRKGGRRV